MMKRLLTLHQQDVTHMEDKPINRDSFFYRMSVRAVIKDTTSGRIALMHSAKNGYYKLPGGGVDDGESLTEALEREALEETGCTIEITGELGEIIEYRDYAEMVQTSICYMAEGSVKYTPTPTEEEIAEQFEVVWAEDIDEAKRLVQSAKPQENDMQTRFMVIRDLAILNASTNQ